LGRGRKAFECEGEDGVGVVGPAGRLIKLGKRERGAQSEAARALRARDGDGALDGLLGRGGIGRTPLQQYFAAHTVSFAQKGVQTLRFYTRERLARQGERGLEFAEARISLSEI
jgi:hypothetical protein